MSKNKKAGNNRIIIFSIIAMVVFCFYFSGNAAAAINQKIDYQGKITDSSGTAVGDGSYCFKFILYNALTGGTAVWSEEWAGSTSKITTSSGLFSVLLGTYSDLSSVNFNQSLYLEVQFDAACKSSYTEIFSPRKALGAVPAAFESGKLEGYTFETPGIIGSSTPNTGNFTTLNASTLIASTISVGSAYTFPATAGTAGNYLKTNGDGTLSWSSIATISGMLYPGAGIAVSNGSGWGASITDNSANWDAGYTYRLTSATGSSPLTLTLSSNGLTGSITKADASTNGYLASADWTIFNGKQGALVNSAGLATALSDETGTGSVVFSNNPILVAPTLGAATATSINGLTFASQTTGFTIAGGTSSKTLTLNDNFNASTINDFKTSMDALTGIIKSNGSGTYSAITDNSANWDAGYTYRLTSASGTAPLTLTLSSNGLTGSITKADASTNGYLASADWTIFNNKLATNGSIAGLTGTISSTVLGNSTVYIGSTAVLLNRGTGNLALTGITSIDGSAASVTGLTLTTNLTNNGGTGILTWPATGTTTLIIPTNGGTLGSAAFTASTAYLTVGGTATDSAKLGGTAAASYALLASPTFSGTVVIPSPFTLGAISMTSTGTQLNYLNAATGTTGTTSTNLVFSDSPTIVTPTFTTNITTPYVIGGTLSTSDLFLQVTSNATATTGADMHFLVGNNGVTEAMTILNSGYVGIGNTAPGSALDIKGTLRLSGATSGYLGFSVPASAGSTIYTLPSADGSSGYALTTNGSGTLSWAAAGGAQTPWTSAISAAGYTLNGNSTASGNLTLDSTSNGTKGYVLLNPTGGLVGVGVTTPAGLLNLGEIRTSGTMLKLNYPAADSLAGTVYGLNMDLSTNVTPGAYTIYGTQITMPSSGTGSRTFATYNEDATNLYNFDTINAAFSVPVSVQSAGDVSMAYDLQFTNDTASNIKSYGPLYVTSGDVNSNSDLVLSAAGTGVVIANDNFEVDSIAASGNMMSIQAPSAVTLAGALTGLNLDLSTNYTATGFGATGQSITMPAVTNTGAGTYAYKGLVVTSGVLIQKTGAGTDTWTGLDITMPAITQTTGTLTSTGLKITGGTVTSGTSYGLIIGATAGNVGIGNTAPASKLDITGTATFGAAGVSDLNLGAQTITLSGANPTTYATFRAASFGVMTFAGTNAGQTITTASTLYVATPATSDTNVTITTVKPIDTQTGGYLSAAGVWTDNSSKTVKTDFENLDPNILLSKINQLTVQEWSYIAMPSVRHIGPFAEDVADIFGVGEDRATLAPLDTAGIALAGVKALSSEINSLRLELGLGTGDAILGTGDATLNNSAPGTDDTVLLDTENNSGILGLLGQKIKDILAGLGMAIDNGIATVKGLFADKVTTKELCVGETCLSEDQLKQLLQNNQLPITNNQTNSNDPALNASHSDAGGQNSNNQTAPDAGGVAVATPTPTPTPDSITDTTPAPSPTPSSEPTPESTVTPTPTPEPTPTATLTPIPEPTPEPTPAPTQTPLPTDSPAADAGQ